MRGGEGTASPGSGVKRQSCINCGGEKESGHGRLFCSECRESDERRVIMCVTCGERPRMSGMRKVCESCDETRQRDHRPCRRCAKNPRVGGNRKLCAQCIAADCHEATLERLRMPCAKCSGPKPPGIGVRLCDECRELVEWQHERRRASRRLPCKTCGSREKRSPGSPYCDGCREARKTENRPCRRCGQPKGAGSGRSLCDKCRPYRRGIRQPCRNCGMPKPPGRGLVYCVSCEPTVEEKKARRAANDRILKRARRLEVVGTIGTQGRVRRGAYVELMRHGHHHERPDLMLNAAPIRAFIQAAEGRFNRNTISELSGINERRIYDLVKGRKTTVSLGVADTLLHAVGGIAVPEFGYVEDVTDLWPDVDTRVAALAA